MKEGGFVYWTIQHRYKGVSDWTYSNYDNIASAVRSEAYVMWHVCYEKGFPSEAAGLVALAKVRLANEKKGETHTFRLVRVIATRIVTPVEEVVTQTEPPPTEEALPQGRSLRKGEL